MSKVESPAGTTRVSSAFAAAERYASLAASIDHAAELEHTPSSSTTSASWNRPAFLKLPSQCRSEPHHWAGTTGDALYLAPSHTPQVDAFRTLQGQFSHPPERSPQVSSVRRQQEDEFRSPLATPAVRKSRAIEEASFKAPPNTPAVTTLRSAETSFKHAPSSDQSELIRQSHEDPFQHGTAGRGFRTTLKLSGTSLQGPQQEADQGAVLSVRQHLEGFRSEPITPTLTAIRNKLEAFVSDKASQDPLKSAIAKQVEDPFGSGPSFRDFSQPQAMQAAN